MVALWAREKALNPARHFRWKIITPYVLLTILLLVRGVAEWAPYRYISGLERETRAHRPGAHSARTNAKPSYHLRRDDRGRR